MTFKRPLTFAASALLLLTSLLAAGPALAQVPDFPDLPPDIRPQPLPPRPPVILIPNQEGESEPIHVRTVDVDVTIDGFLAETTVVMTFFNPSPRQHEGELVFPLPEGATISGYGLDVDGELVDGVVVERQAARVAFETEVRGRIDPGLAEWVQGSVFRTRIFPLPAEGGRTVKVSYVSDLTVVDGTALYQLPMAYTEPLEQLDLRVAVSRGAAEPAIRAAGLAEITFASWEAQWVAETSLTDVSPADALQVAVPMPEHAVLVETTGGGDRYFALVDELPDFEAMPAAAPIEGAVILFDASASRRSADVEREIAMLATWANAHPSTELHVIVLRDRLEPAIAIAEGPDRGDELTDLLSLEPLDGGTDLWDLSFPADLRELSPAADPAQPVDAYLFMTDGLGSLGEPGRVEPDARVFTITSSTQANHAWLREVAERSGGVALNLTRIDDGEAMVAMQRAPLRLAAVEFEPGTVEALEMPSVVVENGRVLVTGRLLADSTRLRLTYHAGAQLMHTSEIAIDTSTEAGPAQPGVVSTMWAQLRLGGLALAPERHRVELLRLGRTFNLVTPHTSYIVLETLEQHLRHGIAPAESRTAMLAQFNEQIEAREVARRESREAKINRVVQMWERRIAWYERTDFAGEVPVGTPSTVPADQRVWEDNDLEVEEEPFMPEPTGLGNRTPPSEMPERETQSRMEMSEDAPAVMGDIDTLSGGSDGLSSGESSGRARRDTAGPGSTDGGDGESSGGTIAVQAWAPDTPYMTVLSGVAPEDAYAAYTDQREAYDRSPAFYLDVASLLYQKGRDAEARRVLTNIAELGLADARLMRIVAYKLQEEGDIDLAIRMFEEVAALRPDEPQSQRDLALALAARADRLAASGDLDDPQAPIADWARAVELLNDMLGSDTGRFEQIEMPALHEVNRILAAMERWAEAELGGADALPSLPLDPRLRRNLDLDVRVLLRWDTDLTDMDLWVDEPTGERAYYGNHDTAIGGLFGRDYTQGYGPEEYVLREAPDGTFTISANFFGSRAQALTGGTTLQVDIFTNYGRANERRQSATVRLTSSGETVEVGTLRFDGDGQPSFDIEEGLEASGTE